MVDFSERLATALAHSNVSTKELRDYLGISYQAMKKLESGLSKSFTAENCARAARFLQVDLFWLATGEGNMVARAQDHPTHHVAEAQPLSLNFGWPFATVTAQQYAQLSDAQRGMVEGYIGGLLAKTKDNHIKSSGTHDR